MGMGVCPWSPLRGGVLTGKFTREGRTTDAVTRVRDDSKFLTERTYVLIDAMRAIADEICARCRRSRSPGSMPSRAAPRRSSARGTERELLDVLGALNIRLSERHLATLDELSRPPEHFPQTFLELAKTTMSTART